MSRFVINPYFFKEFIGYDYYSNDENCYTFSFTLEGQIVAISDEIAQREHDLDDSIRDKDLSLNSKHLFHEILSIIKTVIDEMKGEEDKSGLYLLINSNKSFEGYEKSYSKQTDFIWKKTFVDIISYFIRDVTENSMRRLYNTKKEDIMKIITLSDNYSTKSIHSNDLDLNCQ